MKLKKWKNLRKALRDLGGLPGISDLSEKLRGLNGQIEKIVAQHVPQNQVDIFFHFFSITDYSGKYSSSFDM